MYSCIYKVSLDTAFPLPHLVQPCSTAICFCLCFRPMENDGENNQGSGGDGEEGQVMRQEGGRLYHHLGVHGE